MDADTDAEAVEIAAGDTVTWTYQVTNTGNVPFDEADIVVTDDQEGQITNITNKANGNTDNILDPGETWTYTATSTAEDLVTVIDFETDLNGTPLPAGTFITNQYAAAGLTVSATPEGAMIFDSANPTGGDFDLATPDKGNILIISEDGDQSDPDDNESGGTITLDWANPIRFDSTFVLDIEEAGSTIETFDAAGNLISTTPIPTTGNAVLQELFINDELVSKIKYNFAGSGATIPEFEITDIYRNEATVSVDGVQYDSDASGYINPVTPITPPVGNPIQIEAEDINNVSGYRIENNGVASGGSMLSLVGGSSGEMGTATFNFTGTSGTYNVIIGSFDENDGNATIEVFESGTKIGTALLDQSPGGNAASADTKVEKPVATVFINTGASLTIKGNEDGGEHARFDYIRFEPVGGMTPVAPVISAPASVTVPENQTFVVDVNATDVNGGPLTYTLTNGDDQADFTINSSTGVLSFIQAPDFENPGDNDGNNIYEVEVSVTDNTGLTDEQFITVTVSDINETPGGNPLQIEAEDISNVSGYRIENNGVASGGSMLSLVGGSSGEMGTATFNFGGTSGNYNVFIGAFDENDGNATIDLIQGSTIIGTVNLDQNPGGNAATADTKVEKPVASGVLINNGTSLTIKGNEDGGEHARFDYIRFEPVGSVTPVAPVISAPASVTVPENQPLVLDVDATDVNGGPLTYSLTDGADVGDFTIDSNTGVLSFIQAPDFENPVDANGDNNYEVEVTVTDNTGLTDEQLITVTVGDVNENPVVTPIKIEAEDIDDITGYRIENNGAASGNQMLSLVGQSGGEIGTANLTFNGTSGNYDVTIGAFDENDGQASFTLDLNGSEIGQVVLDQELGSNVANSNTFVTLGLGSNVPLQPGDILTITGLEDASEHARFDFIEFTPVV